MFLSANLIAGLVEDLGNVKLVEGQMHVRKLILNTADECQRHAATHLLNSLGIAAMLDQVLLESGSRIPSCEDDLYNGIKKVIFTCRLESSSDWHPPGA